MHYALRGNQGEDACQGKSAAMQVKVGIQLHPQHCTYDQLAEAARRTDESGYDSLWTWDHFYPLYGVEGAPMGPDLPPKAGDPPQRGDHFEGWSLLAAFAAITKNVEIGMMVSCNSYRNPELLADIFRTVDHISHGRMIFGIGSGWYEKDYQEYGYEFGTAVSRLKDLEAALPRIKARLQKLSPAPLRDPVPFLIGGGGEKRTLRLVAEHATMWNFAGSLEDLERKVGILDEWCEKVGRDPAEIERSVLVRETDTDEHLDKLRALGISHFMIILGTPFSFETADRIKAKLKG